MAIKPESTTIHTHKIDINGTLLRLVFIPGGSFLMGSPDDELGRQIDEGPQHEVNVPSFWMGRYAVTQAQWRAVASLPLVNRPLDPDPSFQKGEEYPVEQVTWYEAIEFCNRLSAHTHQTFRLPTEAEWEYACRAGTTTPYHFGEAVSQESLNCNYHHPGTAPVDSYRPNAFYLFEMHGNVWEWCLDHWHDNYEGAPTDGSAWVDLDPQDDSRVMRGGSWTSSASCCRAAMRGCPPAEDAASTIGLRVVMAV